MRKIIILLFLICLGICGCNRASREENAINLENNSQQIILGAYRHLAPGKQDAFYCSKILGVWEPLITMDEEGRPKGCLAIGWKMLNDGKEWIFYLRKGVTFHNGTPFNADAVIKNFDRMSLGYRRSNFYGLDLKNYYPSLEKYEKIDDYTIRLLFKDPTINELYKMMNFGSPIFAPECIAEDGSFKTIAIGTGPYKITENVLSKYVTLERYDNYYGSKAHIPKIIVKSIPNADVRYAALRAGEIFGVLDINAIPPFLAEELKKDPRFGISSNKSTMIRLLHLNGGKFPFNDLRMRQAVSLAINREYLVEAIYLNYAEPTSNLVNYTSPYYRAFPVEYNLEKAKFLANEVLQGKRCPIVYCINGGEILQKGEAELIAYWLNDLGLDVIIKTLEYGTMNYILRKGEYDIARTQQGMANGDPYRILYTFMMPDGARNIGSSSGYNNPEVCQLMGTVLHEKDDSKRQTLYTRLQEISVEEQPVVPLFNDKTILAYNRHLKNYDALIYGIDLAKIEWVD